MYPSSFIILPFHILLCFFIILLLLNYSLYSLFPYQSSSSLFSFSWQSPDDRDGDENGTLDLSRAGGMGEGSGGTVLTPLQPMSPQRQALLNSHCYQMSTADCWDLPVDYTKIKRLDEDHKEVLPPSTRHPLSLAEDGPQHSLYIVNLDRHHFFVVL